MSQPSRPIHDASIEDRIDFMRQYPPRDRPSSPRCENHSVEGKSCSRPIGHDGLHVMYNFVKLVSLDKKQPTLPLWYWVAG